MQGVARVALQIFAFGRGGFHEQEQLLAKNGGHRMHARATVGAQRAQVGHPALKTGFAEFGNFRGLPGEFCPTGHNLLLDSKVQPGYKGQPSIWSSRRWR